MPGDDDGGAENSGPPAPEESMISGGIAGTQ